MHSCRVSAAASGDAPRHQSLLASQTLCRPPTCRPLMQQTLSPSRAPQHLTRHYKSSGPRIPVQRPACPRTLRAWGQCRAAAAASAAQQLADGDLQQWDACVDKLTQQGLSEEEAGELLEKAFGWRGQAYWRKSRVKEVPAAEQLDAVLGFLAEQGVDGEHVPPALQRFPEVLALDVDRQLRANIETLQTQWFVRGLALKKLLRSQPQVLGYNVDCGGNCQGDCNRCWARL